MISIMPLMIKSPEEAIAQMIDLIEGKIPKLKRPKKKRKKAQSLKASSKGQGLRNGVL